MVNLAIVRNLALVIGICMLLLAEFLHPVFHNRSICFWQESQGLNASMHGVQCFTQDDSKSVNNDGEYACPICSSGFLTYCANDSPPIVLCDYQDIAVLSPLPDFIFAEINLTDSPRAPPVVLL